MSLVLFVVLVVAAYARTTLRSPTRAPGHYTLLMTDYAYTPSHMTWRVGEHVTLTLINQSGAHPGKTHEFMMGRVPRKEQTPFGLKQEDGFEKPFFRNVDIRIEGGRRLKMLMPGGAHVSGVNPKDFVVPPPSGMRGMGEEMGGFMPVLMPTGRLTFSFTVPDKPGDWTYGCFQQSGQHFLNGMRGTVTILKAST